MPSLDYEEIYSKFRLKASAYDLLDFRDDDVNAFLCDWMHSAIHKPYIYRLFTNAKFHDEIQQFDFTMKYSVNDDFDKELITDVVGIGLVIEWITPKINNLNNIVQVYGSSEEKYYSQAAHLNTLMSLKDGLIREQRNIIRDRGYIWNSYLDGES